MLTPTQYSASNYIILHIQYIYSSTLLYLYPVGTLLFQVHHGQSSQSHVLGLSALLFKAVLSLPLQLHMDARRDNPPVRNSTANTRHTCKNAQFLQSHPCTHTTMYVCKVKCIANQYNATHANPYTCTPTLAFIAAIRNGRSM